MQMKVILYMAMSANGIIARKNNEEDFLSHDNWDTLVTLAKQYGNLIWGRRTYEVVKTWGKEYLDAIKEVKKIIVSKDADIGTEANVETASSPEEALTKLQNYGFSEALLSGGSTLNASFAKRGLLDEVILNINSVIVGEGIPVFAPQELDVKLELLNNEKISKDIIQLHYKMLRS